MEDCPGNGERTVPRLAELTEHVRARHPKTGASQEIQGIAGLGEMGLGPRTPLDPLLSVGNRGLRKDIATAVAALEQKRPEGLDRPREPIRG